MLISTCINKSPENITSSNHCQPIQLLARDGFSPHRHAGFRTGVENKQKKLEPNSVHNCYLSHLVFEDLYCCWYIVPNFFFIQPITCWTYSYVLITRNFDVPVFSFIQLIDFERIHTFWWHVIFDVFYTEGRSVTSLPKMYLKPTPRLCIWISRLRSVPPPHICYFQLLYIRDYFE